MSTPLRFLSRPFVIPEIDDSHENGSRNLESRGVINQANQFVTKQGPHLGCNQIPTNPEKQPTKPKAIALTLTLTVRWVFDERVISCFGPTLILKMFMQLKALSILAIQKTLLFLTTNV
jgi:hypothetical protein